MTLKVITANRLRDGEVVYLTVDGGWSEWLTDSVTAVDSDSEAGLVAIAERAVEARTVVGPYLMAVQDEDGELVPLGQREIIRAKGPSVRPDLGKQALGS